MRLHQTRNVQWSVAANHFQQQRQKAHHLIGFANLGKEIGRRWKCLSGTDRMPYKKMAEQETQRYERELKAYKEKQAAVAAAKATDTAAAASETSQQQQQPPPEPCEGQNQRPDEQEGVGVLDPTTCETPGDDVKSSPIDEGGNET